MISITAIRGAGDHPGDDIVEPLLSTQAAALERARVELDKGALQSPIRIECRYQSALEAGDLVQVSDAALGEVYKATVTGVEHQAISGGAISFVTVLKPDG